MFYCLKASKILTQFSSVHVCYQSGSGLFLTKDNVRYVAGVNSAGYCCKYGSMDAYSRLSIKYKWIAKTMKDDAPADFNCETLVDDGYDESNDDSSDDEESDDDEENNDDSGGCEDTSRKFKINKLDKKVEF